MGARRLLPRQLHENVDMAYAMEQASNEGVGHGELQSFDHRVTEMSNSHAFGPYLIQRSRDRSPKECLFNALIGILIATDRGIACAEVGAFYASAEMVAPF